MNRELARLHRLAGRPLGIVNPLGWTVLVAGVCLVVAAAYTDWRELAVLAAACLLVFVLAMPFLVGRTRVQVDVVLQPERVIAGGSVAAGVRVRNIASHGLLPTMLELPVGSMVHRYGVPRLGPDETHEESFTIRTERRGVIPVGPATTRRGDPLGMLSRDVEWTDVVEILVRPQMVPMDSLGAGLLRDLEGVSTDAVSQSDLAFHALREYVSGDDLRHVHWRSSAKAMAVADDSRLLVRQYLDTRRSHVTLVVDDHPGVWAEAQDFEIAMSVAASIIVRATLDEFDTSFVCGTSASSGVTGHLALDSVCRADFGTAGPGLLGAPGSGRLARHQPAVPGRRRGLRLRGLPARGHGLPARSTPLRLDRGSHVAEPGHRDRWPRRDPGRRQGRPRRAAEVVPTMRFFRRLTLGQARLVGVDARVRARADRHGVGGSRVDLHRDRVLVDRHDRRVARRADDRRRRGHAPLAQRRGRPRRGRAGTSCSARCCACDSRAPPRRARTSWRLLVDEALYGWKDLLTTLPPVDGESRLLVLPWLMGLVAGLLGAALSLVHTRRPRVAAPLPLIAPLALLALVILLGVSRPEALWLQGSVFAVLALAWLGLRYARVAAPVTSTQDNTRGKLARLGTGAALVGIAGLLALPVGTWAAGGDEGRVILRTHVDPPFDVGQYPSPLASFRRFVELPKGQRTPLNLHDTTLFTIEGVPTGSRVRIAVLDRYDGVVWGASNNAQPGVVNDTYQRVSSVIDNPVDGWHRRRTGHHRARLGWRLAADRRSAADPPLRLRPTASRSRSRSATTSPRPRPSCRLVCSRETSTPSPRSVRGTS